MKIINQTDYDTRYLSRLFTACDKKEGAHLKNKRWPGSGRIMQHGRVVAVNKIDDDPVKVVERVQQTFSLTDDERGGVLRHLIDGGDLSQWGMVNAITRYSQDVEDYDRATEFEKMGGKVLELPQRQWSDLAQAG